ncbi:MAG: MOSC domain-containing protein [Pseudomonadota bacterium]
MQLTPPTAARVESVAIDATHRFSKSVCEEIRLLEGLGVEGDAHMGETVKHRSRVKRDPTQPNLRQVHLIHGELFDELSEEGFDVSPGDLGENVTTRGIALLDLPKGALLELGESAVVEITGLRNPCHQIEDFMPGLLSKVLIHRGEGQIERKTGVMGIVKRGGPIKADDPIRVRYPEPPYLQLERV